MSLEDDIAFFEQVPTFAALGKQALRILAIGAETRQLANGAVLFYAGELADGGYVVQEGALVLEPNSAMSDEQFIAGPGTLVSERALFTETVCSSTAIARGPTVVDPHLAQPVPQDDGGLPGRRAEIARHDGGSRRRLDARTGQSEADAGVTEVTLVTAPPSPSPARGRRAARRRGSPWRS